MAYYVQFGLIPVYWLLVFVSGILSAIIKGFRLATWETANVIAEHKRHYGKK